MQTRIKSNTVCKRCNHVDQSQVIQTSHASCLATVKDLNRNSHSKRHCSLLDFFLNIPFRLLLCLLSLFQLSQGTSFALIYLFKGCVAILLRHCTFSPPVPFTLQFLSGSGINFLMCHITYQPYLESAKYLRLTVYQMFFKLLH